jgi:hypothetical protein
MATKKKRRKNPALKITADAFLRIGLKTMAAFVPPDYDAGAQFSAQRFAFDNFDRAWLDLKKACEPRPQIEAPGVVNLVKDPQTGEWK